MEIGSEWIWGAEDKAGSAASIPQLASRRRYLRPLPPLPSRLNHPRPVYRAPQGERVARSEAALPLSGIYRVAHGEEGWIETTTVSLVRPYVEAALLWSSSTAEHPHAR